MKRLLLACLVSFNAIAYGAQDYHTQQRIQQNEIDRRMNEIQTQMRTESSTRTSTLSATTASPTTGNFGPTLPGYRTASIKMHQVTDQQVKQYLEKLGDPEKETGVFAYPKEVRLYHYGLMCLEIGLFDEGFRAISDYLKMTSGTEQ